jgi:hypothetical protein
LFAAWPAPATAQSDPVTLFHHDGSGAFYIGGQINVIAQAHPGFPSPYSGANSLRAPAEHAVSRLLTFYAAVRLGAGWDVTVHVESAGGSGLSDALGLAGFTNLDVVRNPSLGTQPYLARLLVHKTFAFSDITVPRDATPFGPAAALPVRRLEIRAGKLGMADVFDVNAVGSDSHLQFTNWTVDNNGAYDYAADTRGYTYGVVAEYAAPRWSLRGAEALMPTVANGIELDWNLARARGENVELELRPAPSLTVRALGYANHANMGRYDVSIQAFEAGAGTRPIIEASREQGRVKYGAGVNAEWAAPGGTRLFGRSGWNEGHQESFAYTEVNDTVAVGGDQAGHPWHRAGDRAGIAFVSNGLSGPHREYLRLGGLGFLLGDGTLDYGRETIVEGYYTGHVWRGVFASGGAERIWHPGYNRDRGPVVVPMARLHLDF